MAKRTVICLLIVLLVCDSCFRNSRLDSIESYIQERPDSALVELQNLSPSALKGKAEKARYALLYSIALDKNYIDISSDSTISQAVVWFEKTRDRHRLMQSYYYAGKVEYNAGNYAKAISYGQRALDLAEQTSEKFYSGLICWLIGDITFPIITTLKQRVFMIRRTFHFLKPGRVVTRCFPNVNLQKWTLQWESITIAIPYYALFINSWTVRMSL